MSDKYTVFFQKMDFFIGRVHTMSHNRRKLLIRLVIFPKQPILVINSSVKFSIRMIFLYPLDFRLAFRKMGLHR